MKIWILRFEGKQKSFTIIEPVTTRLYFSHYPVSCKILFSLFYSSFLKRKTFFKKSNRHSNNKKKERVRHRTPEANFQKNLLKSVINCKCNFSIFQVFSPLMFLQARKDFLATAVFPYKRPKKGSFSTTCKVKVYVVDEFLYDLLNWLIFQRLGVRFSVLHNQQFHCLPIGGCFGLHSYGNLHWQVIIISILFLFFSAWVISQIR